FRKYNYSNIYNSETYYVFLIDFVENEEGTDPNDPKSNPDTKDTEGDGFPDKVEKAEGKDRSRSRW
ncbi:hypothetical protein, partial [Streptococcus pseudopneumoniae]|uniref:hypothetical protein n=1 Tax=Streptococcus pseudopneumoniae TaxID=257758 RepID=UPI0019D60374